MACLAFMLWPQQLLHFRCILCLMFQVTMVGVQLSPPVTFQLRAGSGPVFLSGQERYGKSEQTWEEEEEEEGEEEEEEEEEEDDEDEDVDISLEEESPVKQGKRLVPQKQTSVAKKKKLEKEQEEVRPKPHPDPKSQDSRNEELRFGGHNAEWAFPSLCYRDRAPLPHPCICLNMTGCCGGNTRALPPHSPLSGGLECRPPPRVTIKLSGQDFPSLPCCWPPYPLHQPKCPAEGGLEPAHPGPEVMPPSLDPPPSA
ncbi:nucleoplasmin-2 isoform X6 [Sapajus apella]|uniref:Nucleoplasmin-2 isoform X6 n=1 Tax=Sapajus apella TaxID=9515 RepID=A0A6J3IP66_SAPAP|nr:nucleoplasmin-2 isoform X6 [Sapajus apella]